MEKIQVKRQSQTEPGEDFSHNVREGHYNELIRFMSRIGEPESEDGEARESDTGAGETLAEDAREHSTLGSQLPFL